MAAKTNDTEKKNSALSKLKKKEQVNDDAINNTEAVLEQEQEPEDDGVIEDELVANDVSELEEDTDEIMEALIEAYKRRKVNSLDYSERKKRAHEGIVADDRYLLNDENRAKTREDNIRDEYKELAAATNTRSRVIKWIHLDGMEEDEKYGYVVVGHLSNRSKPEFRIKIATSELEMFNLDDFKTDNALNLFEREIQKWIGNDIQAMIFQVNEENCTAIASRLAASEILARRYFRAKKGSKAFGEGNIVTATVMTTRRDRIKVCAYGQDMTIKSEEASWLSQNPLDIEFRKGEKVNVKLLEVNNDFVYSVNNKNYHLAKIKGSIRQATENPNEIYFDQFKVGGRYEGVIKNSTVDGKIFVTLGGVMDCLCNPAAVGAMGSRCLVKITKADDKKKFIWGDIINPDL